MTVVPTITNVNVRTSTVDEWYGIEVTFDWASAPDPVPNDTDYAAGRAMLHAILPQVLASDSYATYYAQPHKVSVDLNGSDETQREVWIPAFSRPEQFGQYEFWASGGWLLASDR